jgi:hypothetical protein
VLFQELRRAWLAAIGVPDAAAAPLAASSARKPIARPRLSAALREKAAAEMKAKAEVEPKPKAEVEPKP